MWIRSQDKMNLINCTWVVTNKSKCIVGADTSTDAGSWTLGKYKSKKRCLEVLDEIHNHLFQGRKDIPYQMPKK